MPVVDVDDVYLNGNRFHLANPANQYLLGNFAQKMVIGDYSLESNPEVSEWAGKGYEGGQLVEEWRADRPNCLWFSNCITDFTGHVLMPRKFVSITRDTPFEVVNSTFDSDYAGWTDTLEGTITWNVSYGYDGGGVQVILPSGTPGDFISVMEQTATNPTALQGAKITISYFIWRSSLACVPRIYDGVSATVGLGSDADYEWTFRTLTHTVDASATTLKIQIGAVKGASQKSQRIDNIYCCIETGDNVINNFINYEGNLYWTRGNVIYKLNDTGDNFDLIANIPHYYYENIIPMVWYLEPYITRIFVGAVDWGDTPTISVLYLFMGDDHPYYHFYYNGTDPTLVEHALINDTIPANGAYYGVVWDNKLWRINTAGEMWYSANPGDTTPTWTVCDAIPNISAETLRDPLIYQNIDGDETIYMPCPDVLKVYDSVADEWLDTQCTYPAHPYGSYSSIFWRDGIYTASGLNITSYTASAPALINTKTGLDQSDSLPSTLNGCIQRLCAGYDVLYALVDSSLVTGTGYSSIWALYNGAWTCWWYDSVADQALDTIIVSSAYQHRLWVISDDTTPMYYEIPYGVINPLQLSDYEFDSGITGLHITPKFDAAWQAGNKLALQLAVGSRDCSVDNHIAVYYRTGQSNHDFTSNWTELGTIGDSTRPMKFTFDNGIGMLFDYIQFKFELTSASDDESPDLLYFILSYVKIIPPSWGWVFQIDCSNEYDGRNSEQQIAELEDLALTQTLIALRIKDETRYVRIKSVESVQTTGESDIGTYKVTAIQPIP